MAGLGHEAKRVMNNVASAASGMASTSSKWTENARQLIRDHPIAAGSILLASGALLGALYGRPRRSDSPMSDLVSDFLKRARSNGLETLTHGVDSLRRSTR
ncbi:MAG: hypothetical protein ACKVPX_09595 [Myxococcaceae bacterium]